MSAKRKNLNELTYSPAKKGSSKHNNVFLREYSFGVLVLECKKSSDPKEDAFLKTFIDALDDKPQLAKSLGIIKVVNPRASSKASVAKVQPNGYKCKVFLGIVPKEKENDPDYRRLWCDKIIAFLNNEVKWQYSNSFKFRGDLTKTVDGRIINGLDEILLDEDIGGIVSSILFESDDLECVVNDNEVLEAIFSHPENLDVGESILRSNWDYWTSDD